MQTDRKIKLYKILKSMEGDEQEADETYGAIASEFPEVAYLINQINEDEKRHTKIIRSLIATLNLE